MQKDIFVTGIGIISAIGNNSHQCLQSLKEEKTGVDKIKYLKTIHKDSFNLAEVKMSNEQLLDYLNLPGSEYRNHTRTSLLGCIAAKEALDDSQINLKDKKFKTALISATTVGGMDKTESDILNSDVNIDFLYTHACGDSTNKIAKHIGLDGYRTTISTACSSGTNAIIHGIQLIRNGIVDRAIVGGVDALSKFTLNGFNSLMILDKGFCKPFDENRKGLNLGEAAGFIVIESSKSLKDKEKQAYCKISGFSNANDAYHQTASSPEGEGAYRAMKSAIEMSPFKAEEIDYINVHGTGTSNNDLSEGTAIKRIYGEDCPKFSSTKAYTGHTLGAAAGIEAVFSVMSIREGLIYPNLNFETPISELNMIPETQLLKTDVKSVLSNSFGFGGNNSSILFSKL